MMTGIELRKLKLADIPSIEQVERRAYSTPWSRTMFAGEIAKPTSRCFGAFDGDRLAGYLIVSRYVDAWHIMNVAVDPDRRRTGIATAMLADLLRRIDGHGARFTLEVRESNAGAIELYERFGFRAAGRRRRYYQDNGEDAVVMWRTQSTLAGRLDDVPNASSA